MQLSGEKARQLWLPFLVLAVIVLAASWMLPGIIYPDDIRAEGGRAVQADDSNAVRTIVIDPKAFGPDPDRLLSVQAGGTPTLTPTKMQNCTYTRHYWREHPDSWVFDNVVIANLNFTKSEALDILSIESQSGAEDPDPARLLQEFFAALLNTLKGAEAKAIEPALVEASGWLNAHPEGAELSESERGQALGLIQALSDYNNGFSGPQHCPDEPLTQTSAPSLTQTVTGTPVPRPGIIGGGASSTPTAGGGGAAKTPTPTGTLDPGTPGPVPSATPQPTSPEPTSPADTQPPSPEPTPPPATQTPSPEPTLPPATQTPSQEPTLPPASTPTSPPPTATLFPSDTPIPEPTDTLEPPPPPTATEPGGDCSPAYPDFCIPPPPPDLDCADIPQKNFTVLPPDPHNLDSDGDGIGCEDELP